MPATPPETPLLTPESSPSSREAPSASGAPATSSSPIDVTPVPSPQQSVVSLPFSLQSVSISSTSEVSGSIGELWVISSLSSVVRFQWVRGSSTFTLTLGEEVRRFRAPLTCSVHTDTQFHPGCYLVIGHRTNSSHPSLAFHLLEASQ